MSERKKDEYMDGRRMTKEKYISKPQNDRDRRCEEPSLSRYDTIHKQCNPAVSNLKLSQSMALTFATFLT